MTDTGNTPERKDIPQHLKWQPEDLFQDYEQWKSQLSAAGNKLKVVAGFKHRLSESTDTLYEAISIYEETAKTVEKVFFYAHLKKDEDNTCSQYQAMLDQAQNLLIQFEAAASFLIPEILSLDEVFLKNALVETRFKDYTHFLNNLLRKKAHILSSREEEILALSGEIAQAPRYIFSMINDADIRFPQIEDQQGNTIELTKGNFTKFMENRDRKIRKKVFNQLYGTYSKQKNTIAATLAYSVKKDLFYARIRQYDSSLDAALFEDNIPSEVYDNLIESVHNYLPALQQYLGVKQQALKLEKMHSYDLYVPLVEDSQSDYPYQQATGIIKECLKAMGPDYLKIINLATGNRWIDVVETRGKTSGAYSWGCYDCHPFILLNYQNNLDSMFTIAHELGHAVHSYLSNKNQPYINSSYSIFLAEIASTLNEIMLTEYLLKNNHSREKKIYVLNHYLEQFRNTVFRQTMFAEFEKTIHHMAQNQQPLTQKNLSDIYFDLNKKYYGPGLSLDEGIEMEWARIPHFYNSFYVYKYATGFCAASALAQKIRQEQGYLDRYMEFLSSGGSDYAINLLKKLGVDMTKPEPVNLALDSFVRLVDQLKDLI